MTLARYVRPLSAALLLVSLSSGSASAQVVTPVPTQFFVFGDSLADTGNVWLTSKILIHAGQTSAPAPPPSDSPNLTYDRGRFSNGPVAVEYLWDTLRAGTLVPLRPYIAAPFIGPDNVAVNFAFGGTGTPYLDRTPGGLWAPGLLGQVELFALALRGRQPSATALYVVVTGANDYRADEYNRPMNPQDVVANISRAVTRLHSLGARDVLLLSLPDLGKLPYLTPEAAAQGSAVAADHNARLVGAAARLSSSFPGLKLRLVDVNEVFARLRAALEQQPPPMPLPFPLWALPALDVLRPVPPGTPPTSACLFLAPQTCPNLASLAAPPLLFWDVVHPTTDAHRALGDYLYGVLAATQ